MTLGESFGDMTNKEEEKNHFAKNRAFVFCLPMPMEKARLFEVGKMRADVFSCKCKLIFVRTLSPVKLWKCSKRDDLVRYNIHKSLQSFAKCKQLLRAVEL